MRPARLYPFLLSAVPVLHIVADNPGESSLVDLLLVLAATVALAALFHLGARLALGRQQGPRLAPLVTLVAMAWFLGYRAVAEGSGLPHLVLVPLLGVVSAGLLVLGYRLPDALERAGSFLGLTGLLLAAFAVTDIARDRMRSAAALRDSELIRRLARPVPAPREPSGPKRDIYLIVLDEYANSRVLRERFGFDNRAFEDSLRALGFHIPRVVRSNYAHTMLSIPSLLNAAHLAPLADEVGRGSTDPTLANRLLDRSRVAEFLKQHGYRYVFFPSRWWYSTRHSPLADVEPQVWDGSRPLRELGKTELRRAVLGASIVPGRLLRTMVWDADHVRRSLAGVTLAHRFGDPVFAVAHVISPHAPYAVDGACRSPPRRISYVGQLECVNRQILQLVTELLASSAVPPIILLQGDHGTATLGYSDWPSAVEVPAAAARERFGAFGAYYLPDGGAAEFGDTVTVVNVMGNVLRHYFGARLPREPDTQYLSLERAPYDFRLVDPAWLAPRPGLNARAAAPGRRVGVGAP
jgi:hypothetical protein